MSFKSGEIQGKRKFSPDSNVQTQVSKASRLDQLSEGGALDEELDLALLKFKFISQVDFKMCSFDLIRNTIEKFSQEWNFVSFTDNHSGCLITVESDKCESLLNVTSIINGEENLDVKFSVHSEGQKKGMIFHSYLIPVTRDSLLEQLEKQGVNDVIKLKKQGIDSGAVILFFKKDFKTEIKACGIKRRVRQLVPRPMVCFHCGLIGHTEARCKRRDEPLCNLCFEIHGEGAVCVIQCKNCGRYHKSTNFECKVIQEEIQILKIRENYGIGYLDAKDVYENNSSDVFIEVRKSQEEQVRENIKDEEIRNLIEATKNLFSELAEVREKEGINSRTIDALNVEISDLKAENQSLDGKLKIVETDNAKILNSMKIVNQRNRELEEIVIPELQQRLDQTEIVKKSFEIQIQSFCDDIKRVSKTNVDGAKQIAVLKEKYESNQKNLKNINEELKKSNNHLKNFIKFTPQIGQEYNRYMKSLQAKEKEEEITEESSINKETSANKKAGPKVTK